MCVCLLYSTMQSATKVSIRASDFKERERERERESAREREREMLMHTRTHRVSVRGANLCGHSSSKRFESSGENRLTVVIISKDERNLTVPARICFFR